MSLQNFSINMECTEVIPFKKRWSKLKRLAAIRKKKRVHLVNEM